MKYYKLLAASGVAILATAMILIAHLVVKSNQGLDAQARELAVTKDGQDVHANRIWDMQAKIDSLSKKLNSSENNGNLSRSELQRSLNQLESNYTTSQKDYLDFRKRTRDELTEARRQIDLAGKQLNETRLFAETLKRELERLNKELKETKKDIDTLKYELGRSNNEMKVPKTAPPPAPKAASAISSGQPK